jgi:AcrR family transcriptional regulator
MVMRQSPIPDVRPRSRARGRVTREKILASAARTFAEKGYHQTSLQDVLESLKATKGAFYHHWSCKENLAVEILTRIEEEFAQMLAAALEGASTGREMIDAIFFVYNQVNHRTEFQGIRIFLNFHVGLSRENEPVLYRKIEDGIRGTDDLWRSVVRTGQADGTIRSDLDLEDLVQLVCAAWFGHHVIRDESSMRESSRALQVAIRSILLSPAPEEATNSDPAAWT